MSAVNVIVWSIKQVKLSKWCNTNWSLPAAQWSNATNINLSSSLDNVGSPTPGLNAVKIKQKLCWVFVEGRWAQGTGLPCCPGFGQDRVNFHQNPGRDTAGRADPTWPNRAGYSIPCAVMLGSGGGELGGGNALVAQEFAVAVVEGSSLGCAVCVVFSPYLYLCCYCSRCLLLC